MTKLIEIAQICFTVAQMAGTTSTKILARAIGTMIFDIPTTRSGMVSVGLINEYGYRPSISKCTLEHFHSRNESGYHIIKMVSDGCTLDDVITFLEEATTVHLTTAHENHVLSQIQNHPTTKNLSWQQQYELAGIELVADPGTMPRKLLNKIKKGLA